MEVYVSFDEIRKDGDEPHEPRNSHLTKAQLSQNMRVTKVDVSSSQNCRTASCKSTVKRRGNINAVAELDRTSMIKSAST